MKRTGCLRLLGLVWFAVGLYLLQLGLRLVVMRGKELDGESIAAVVIAFALACGFFKGKFVMQKAANRGIDRVKQMQEPIPFGQIFDRRYLILVAVMMGLGILMRYVDPGIRGLVDVAVGSALIQGSVTYFKASSVTCDNPTL